MLLPNHDRYSPNPKDANSWRHEEKWLELGSKTSSRLDDERFNSLEQKIKTFARSSIAYQLLQQLKPLAERQLSRDVQAAIKVVITVAGGFTYGAGMRVITAGLGMLALPAGLLGGAIASFIVDRLAVEANTNRLKKERVLRWLRSLHQQMQEAKEQDPPKPFQVIFCQEQIKLICKIEGEALQPSLPTKALWAIGLSVIEYAVAVWIVQNVAILALIPIPIRMIVAALPVVLTHAAALAQALAFEMPRYARDELVPHYRNEVTPHPDLSTAEMSQWRLFQEFDNGGLNAWIANQFDRHPIEPTPPLARLRFEREYLTDGIQQLQAQFQGEERKLWARHEQKVVALPNQFPEPEIDETGRTELELSRIRREIAKRRDQWVQAQTQILLKQTQQEVEQLRDEYNAALGLWQGAVQQVDQHYDILYQRWEKGEKSWNDQDDEDIPPDSYNDVA